jgi:hypothetical protein
MLNDKIGVDYDADCVPSVSTSGLPQVGIYASESTTQRWRQTALSPFGVQQLQLGSSNVKHGVLPADSCIGSSGQQGQQLAVNANDSSQRAGESAAATCERTVHLAAKAGSGAAAGADMDIGAWRFPTQKIPAQGKGASGHAPLSATHAQDNDDGMMAMDQSTAAMQQQSAGGSSSAWIVCAGEVSAQCACSILAAEDRVICWSWSSAG